VLTLNIVENIPLMQIYVWVYQVNMHQNQPLQYY